MNPRDPGRNNPSPGVHIDSSRPTWVLLTVTTKLRVPWLANPIAHKLLEQTWRDATAWLVTDYLLMPDHLHCFCAPRDTSLSIETWITYWKSQFRKQHKNEAWHFQSRGWHHRLRDDECYAEKWHYVQQNPVRKNLVPSPDQWPFKGRVHTLRFS